MTGEQRAALASDLPAGLGAPARRALAAAGYTSLAQLSAVAEADLLALHGMGPKALGQLREALAARGLAFAGAAPAAPDAASPPPRGKGAAAVDAFMERLEHPRKAEIAALRAIILSADPRIAEGVKWNAPSFALADHFATLKLRPEATVQVVLHTGARVRPNPTAMRIDDPAGLLAWATPDRAVVTFADMAAIQAGQAAFVAALRQWIAQL